MPLFIDEKFSHIEYLVIDYNCAFIQLLSLIRHITTLRRLSAFDLVNSVEDVRTDAPTALTQLTHIPLYHLSIDFRKFLQKTIG